MEKIVISVRWKQIRDLEGWFVSNKGHVRFKGRIIDPPIKASGYKYMAIRQGKGYYRIDVHRIVWECFGDGRKPSKDLHIHHVDFDKLNNDISNLCLLPAKDHSHIHR